MSTDGKIDERALRAIGAEIWPAWGGGRTPVDAPERVLAALRTLGWEVRAKVAAEIRAACDCATQGDPAITEACEYRRAARIAEGGDTNG